MNRPLLKLSRLASRYGMDPEAVGGFAEIAQRAILLRADYEYMQRWITYIGTWTSPQASTHKQNIARSKWDRLIKTMENK